MKVTTIRNRLTVAITIIITLISVTYAAFTFNKPAQTQEKLFVKEETVASTTQKHIEVFLDTKQLKLYEGNSLIQTFPIISIGKPGSYYETIGGNYIVDYKTELHLSTIGHVYMPYSVHVFGNYFIHGIPYYENGKKVTSSYSGGCIRLQDEDAEYVYNFVNEGTPILITKNNIEEFVETKISTTTFTSYKMTNFMVGAIALEVLNQNNIPGLDNMDQTSAKNILKKLLIDGDIRVGEMYAQTYDQEKFLQIMNKKALAIGLSNTIFTSITDPVTTTFEDYIRFMEYITNYKSYMLTI